MPGDSVGQVAIGKSGFREAGFVQAARLSGNSEWRLLLTQIVPNIMPIMAISDLRDIMPLLPKAHHERFAQALAKGKATRVPFCRPSPW